MKKQRKTNLPAWIRAIPEGSHGSGTLQKRLWKLVSDYVRIRDWETYGTCVASGKRIINWTDGQAGHYKSYTSCRGIFKFDPMNIFLQTAQSNKWGRKEDWDGFKESIIKRHGENYLDLIEDRNKRTELPIPNSLVLKEIAIAVERFKAVTIKPSYYQRVLELNSLT